MNFESEAERIAYPIIRTFAIQNKFKFSYQVPVGLQSGGYATRREYYESNGWEYEDWMDDYYDYWEDNSWECELYRIDFVLEKNDLKYAFEIDGKEYHSDKEQQEYDIKRDITLSRWGYIVIRIPADEVLFKPYLFKERLSNIDGILFFKHIIQFIKTTQENPIIIKKGLEYFFR